MVPQRSVCVTHDVYCPFLISLGLEVETVRGAINIPTPDMKELQLEGPSNSGTIIIVSTIITNFRCLRKHSNCQFLQIELNNSLLYILHQSIKVLLIAVSLEQLIYLFLTRYCLLPIPPRTPVQRHPFPLGRQNYLNKDG